jgi:HEAT repeat protein
MNKLMKLPVFVALLALSGTSIAQSDAHNDADELKIAALEALISAPPERALPLANKVLAADNSDEVKERALFILSQIDDPQAQATLVRYAREASGSLQEEAIRMIGIGGDAAALAELGAIYSAGNSDVRDAVLEAYLIADDKQAVFEIAVNADNTDDFEEAVETLGAMGASDELRELRSRTGVSESLIEAYAISGDLESLLEVARDGSDADMQAEAVEALGIIGGDQVNAELVEIYRAATSEDIREAALDGMLIAGYDEGVLQLYRSSQSTSEKKELLEYLVMMDSDAVWEIVDAALEGGQ